VHPSNLPAGKGKQDKQGGPCRKPTPPSECQTPRGNPITTKHPAGDLQLETLQTNVYVYSYSVTFPLKNTTIHTLQPLDSVKPLLNVTPSPLPAPDRWQLPAPCPLRPHEAALCSPAALGGLHRPSRPATEQQPSRTQLEQTPAYRAASSSVPETKLNAKNQPSPIPSAC